MKKKIITIIFVILTITILSIIMMPKAKAAVTDLTDTTWALRSDVTIPYSYYSSQNYNILYECESIQYNTLYVTYQYKQYKPLNEDSQYFITTYIGNSGSVSGSGKWASGYTFSGNAIIAKSSIVQDFTNTSRPDMTGTNKKITIISGSDTTNNKLIGLFNTYGIQYYYIKNNINNVTFTTKYYQTNTTTAQTITLNVSSGYQLPLVVYNGTKEYQVNQTTRQITIPVEDLTENITLTGSARPTYTVSSNIINGTLTASGSGNMSVIQGDTWSGYITPNEGYEYPLTYSYTISYTMGGSSYGPYQMESLGSINISNVQGDLMITATCTRAPVYTKLNIENPDDEHIYLVYSSVIKNGYPAVSDSSTSTEGYTIISYQVDNGYSINYSAFMQEFDGKCEIEIIPNTNNQSFKLYSAITENDITAIPYTNITYNKFSIVTINGSTNISIENLDGFQETNFVITNNTTQNNPFTIIFFSNQGHSLPTESQIESWLTDNNYRPIVNYTYSQSTGVLTIYGNNRTIGEIPQVMITLSLGNTSEFNRGYQAGIIAGKQEGDKQNQQSITDAFNEGQEQGYEIGYNKGINEATEDYGFGDLFFSISNVPTRIIRSMFNYEIFGINIALVVLTLITVVVTIGVVIIIKKTIK